MALWDSMEKFVNESVRISIEAFERTKEMGNLTKLEFELKGLQGKMQKEYARLGGHVYHVLVEQGGETLGVNNETLAARLEAIKFLANQIFAKEKEISSFRADIEERRRNSGEDRAD
jgi:GTPase